MSHSPHAFPTRWTAPWGALLVLLLGCSPGAIIGWDSDFGGPADPDPAARPSWVYPLEGAVLGRNLGGMNLQWRAGAGNARFRVRIDGESPVKPLLLSVDGCPGDKCQLRVPDALWLDVAAAHAGRTVTLRVDAVARPGGPVATSEPVQVAFSRQPLEGRVHYFSSGTDLSRGAIHRASLTDGVAPVILSEQSRSASGLCVGCHALSPDGCRLAANTLDPNDFIPGTPEPRTLIIVAGDDTERSFTPGGARFQSTFQAWSPDGTRLLTQFGGRLTLRMPDGSVVAEVPPELVGPEGENLVTHPDWSPDGQWIVFTRLAPGASSFGDVYYAGDIMLMPYAGGAFGPAQVLVPSTGGEFHYYPTFSPDSRWVLFNSGQSLPSDSREPDGKFTGFDEPSSRLRLVRREGGTPQELVRATRGPRATASWPRFAPHMEDGRAFILFSAKTDYGWVVEQRAVAAPESEWQGRPQLWAAAVELGAPGDPSAAPFWMPFQDPTTRNHTGTWSMAAPTVCP